MPHPKPVRPGFWRWLQRAFLSGVAIVLPFALTVWLVASFVGVVDNVILPLLPDDLQETANHVPGAGLMFALVALTGAGALTANLFGRMIVHEGEEMVERLPLVRTIYGGAKQVLKQLTQPEQRSFKEAVLVEFGGRWLLGFVTNDDADDVAPGMAAVYVPQAPIPTTGFLIYAPRAELRPVPLSAEEALKRVISLGAVQQDVVPVAPNKT
jgi:uncharacterized membrane protein